MKKQTFFMTLFFTLGLALLFFVGFTACQKDGMEAETLLASADGQTTSNGESGGEVTTRSSGTCECEYKIYSITVTNPTSGRHPETQITTSDICSLGCPTADFIYAPCLHNFINYGSCSTDLTGTGSLSFILPTRWLAFNCLISAGVDFTKNFQLWESIDGCPSTFLDKVEGEIVYGFRCRENPNVNCSSAWQDSTSTIVSIPDNSNATIDVSMEGDCGCSPIITIVE